MTMLKIKVCNNCGKEYDVIPTDAQLLSEETELGGFYWNCECGTTLFYPKNLHVKEVS